MMRHTYNTLPLVVFSLRFLVSSRTFLIQLISSNRITRDITELEIAQSRRKIILAYLHARATIMGSTGRLVLFTIPSPVPSDTHDVFLSLLTQFTLKQNKSDPTNTKFAVDDAFLRGIGQVGLSLAMFYWNDVTKKQMCSTLGHQTTIAIASWRCLRHSNILFLRHCRFRAFPTNVDQLKIVCGNRV